jgi:DNA-binding CsgD family transcriptional regulator
MEAIEPMAGVDTEVSEKTTRRTYKNSLTITKSDLKADVEEGLTNAEISEKYDLSPNMVTELMRQAGLTPNIKRKSGKVVLIDDSEEAEIKEIIVTLNKKDVE